MLAPLLVLTLKDILVSPFWVSSTCSLGVLPAWLLASLVPRRSKVWLNIDFARRRTICPGENFRVAGLARQKFPHAAIVAGCSGQIAPLFAKCSSRKPRKTAQNNGSRRHSG